MGNQATEIQGLEQYSFARYADSFAVIPRHLLDNAGLKTTEDVPNLNNANVKEPVTGVNVLVSQIYLIYFRKTN